MTQIVILAAGKGTRMKSDKPKALQEINGRLMIDYLIDSVVNSGISPKPVIIISPEGNAIKDYLGNKCQYVIQKEQLGTGHAVACAKDYLRNRADNILVLNGDHPFLKSSTIKKLNDLHIQTGRVLSMMTLELPDFSGWREFFYAFGRILRDDQGKIIAIKEKKDANPNELAIKEVNPGYYCFKSDWLWENIDKLNRQNKQNEYYITDLVAMAIQQGWTIPSIKINPMEGMGINTLEDLELAGKMLSDASVYEIN